MGLKCAGWTARWKDYKMLCAKLVAEDSKFLWWGTPYKLLRSSTPQITILIGLNKPFGQIVLWVGAILKRTGCNYLQLRAACPRRVPTTLKKSPIMCLFSFDDFTMFLRSVLYWIKLKLSFHLSASVCAPFLDSILHFNPPFCITRLQNSERHWLSLTQWARVGQNFNHKNQ
jgi:hypothetical protein